MEIKDLDFRDMPEVYRLANRSLSEIGVNGCDIDSLVNTIYTLINNKSALTKKTVENDRITGVAAMVQAPSLWNVSEVNAVEAMWHSDPELTNFKRAKVQAALLKEMESWSKDNGCKQIIISVKPELSTCSYLKKHGYKSKEEVLTKEVC